MITSYTYALTQLQSRYIYVSSRDYNDSSQMVCPHLIPGNLRRQSHFSPSDHYNRLFFLRCHCECCFVLLQVQNIFLLTHQAFLPSKKTSAHNHAPQPQQPPPGTTAQHSMQETLLGRDHVHVTPHSHSEADAEASFVIWEHEKEALQSRLSNRREKLFRCVIDAAFAPCLLFLHPFQFCFLSVCLFCPTHSSLSHTHIRGAGGNVTLKSVAGFLRDVASEAVAAAFALIKSLPKVLLHLVIGQETRVFCVETVRATWAASANPLHIPAGSCCRSSIRPLLLRSRWRSNRVQFRRAERSSGAGQRAACRGVLQLRPDRQPLPSHVIAPVMCSVFALCRCMSYCSSFTVILQVRVVGLSHAERRAHSRAQQCEPLMGFF
jgi:hypothetical protein